MNIIRSFNFTRVLFILLIFLSLAHLAQGKGAAAKKLFNVTDFGAKGDGKTLDHQAINKAISQCAAQGGGTVTIPAGKYLCGSIRLKSNINLFIDAGALILAAPPQLNVYDKPEEFPYPQYQDGGHTFFRNSLIWGENLKNVSITGRGMINGEGLTNKDKEHLGDPTGGSVGTGDKSIALKLCSNVLIRDITIYSGGHFGIIVTGCDLITLDNIVIDTNRDGINIDCSTNAIVSNCKVNSPHDDGICIKSSYALNKRVITENIIITNSEVSGYKMGTLLDGTRIPANVGWSAGRIKFGTESNGGFRNCVVSNCTFRNSNGIALEEVDGGIMENIVISNLTMIDISHYPIYITLGTRNRGPKESTKNGSVKNILINNIIVTNADTLSGIQITGILGSPIENVQLQNIQITYKGGGTKAQASRAFPELGKGYPEPVLLGATPSYGIYARHVKDLQLSNIIIKTLSPDQRPVIIAEDADGLEIDKVKAPAVTGVTPYRFDKAEGLKITNTPFLSGAVK